MDPLLGASSILVDNAFNKVRDALDSPRRQLKKQLQAAIGTAPSDIDAAFRTLIAECDLKAYDARIAGQRWTRLYYCLGLPAVVLAAISGATGLASASGRVPAAIIALVSAGLSAGATFLGSEEKQKRSVAMSAAWSELADDTRLQNLGYIRSLQQDDDTEGKNSISDNYWHQVLMLHRRKGRLLRGDAPIGNQVDAVSDRS